MGCALDQAGQEQVVGGLFCPADDRHLLIEREQFVSARPSDPRAIELSLFSLRHEPPPACPSPPSPRPAAVFRCDWLSLSVFSAPPTVQYLRPATSNSSAGNLVMTSQPSAVTTTSSSILAADQPSVAGQYVSSANTIPSS